LFGALIRAAWSISALREILTHRLLVPALYNLAAGGLLPDAFAIIGIARREMSNDAFRSDLAQALRRFAIRGIDERTIGRLLARATYVNSDADDPSIV
jgi:glucose-6-phosphate 1-dehydrogenase